MFKNTILLLFMLAGITFISYATKAPFPPYAKDSLAHLDPRTNVICYESAAGSGGAATEAMTVTGVLAADTVVSVSQKTKGANNVALLGWSTVAADSVTGVWSQDPGAGAVVSVCVGR